MVVYAAMRLFYSQNVNSNLTKQKVFEFKLETEIPVTDIEPGDELLVESVINNDQTESMYLFIEVNTPECDGQSLYELEVNDPWMLVESSAECMVYAYGSGDLIKLLPGESTDKLTSQIEMRGVTNAQYSEIDDINFVITGYGIDTKGNSSDIHDVWNECKALR